MSTYLCMCAQVSDDHRPDNGPHLELAIGCRPLCFHSSPLVAHKPERILSFSLYSFSIIPWRDVVRHSWWSSKGIKFTHSFNISEFIRAGKILTSWVCKNILPKGWRMDKLTSQDHRASISMKLFYQSTWMKKLKSWATPSLDSGENICKDQKMRRSEAEGKVQWGGARKKDWGSRRQGTYFMTAIFFCNW